MMKKFLICAVVPAIILVMSGCVSVDYTGSEYPETTTVQVFKDMTAPPAGYTVMGQCSVSCGARDTTKDELLEKLRQAAMDRGADAVLIKSYAIVPIGSERESQMLDTDYRDAFPEGDAGVSGWDWMRGMFNSSYGSIRKGDGYNVRDFKRVYRADFLKAGDSPVPAAAPVPLDGVGEKLPSSSSEKTADKTE